MHCDQMMPKTAEKESESKSGDEDSLETFLTERQIEVLKMRLCGRSQQEVADSLGTTRSNISILEKRAHQNIARAERTLQQWMMLRAPISLQARAGTDVFDLPKMIFAAADEKHMRPAHNVSGYRCATEEKCPPTLQKKGAGKGRPDLCDGRGGGAGGRAGGRMGEGNEQK